MVYFSYFPFRGNLPKNEDLLHPEDIVKLKRCIMSAKRPGLPAICTHNVIDDHSDPVLCHLRRISLFNNKSDRVKVRQYCEAEALSWGNYATWVSG